MAPTISAAAVGRANLDLRAIRYFVAVADELHFGRAAAQVSLSQSALSRAISALETQLGASLFERTSRRVELTPAGSALLEHAQALLARQAQALDDLRRVKLGSRPVLRLGFVAGLAGPIGTPLLGRFSATHPKTELRLERLPWSEQTAAIREGTVDAGFVRLPWTRDGLHMTVVCSEPRVALMSSRSRLSGATSLRLRDLADEPICRPAAGPPEAVAFWSADDPTEPIRGRRGPSVRALEEALEYAAAGLAIAIVPLSIADKHGRAGLAAVALPDAPPSRVAFAWRRETLAPELHAFLGTVRAVLASRHLRGSTPPTNVAVVNGMRRAPSGPNTPVHGTSATRAEPR